VGSDAQYQQKGKDSENARSKQQPPNFEIWGSSQERAD
jgi:hypothetical protein